MYLGRKINSFSAKDSGVVAPSVQVKRVAAQVELAPKAVELPLEPTAPEVTGAVESEGGLGAVERDRLWGLIGKLRSANARLFKANRRLTKEAEALRSERSDQDQLTVASILEVAPERTSVRS